MHNRPEAAVMQALPTTTSRLLHFQDMLRLEAVKAVASDAAIAAGRKPGPTHHHVMVVDMASQSVV